MSKTHLLDKFMGFTFPEDGEILVEITDFENLVAKMNTENVPLSTEFVVGAIIFEPPWRWYSLKTGTYHKKNQVSLKDLKRFIYIKDDNRIRHSLETFNKQNYATNILFILSASPKLINAKLLMRAPAITDTNKKNKMFMGKCYNYNKWSHCASECRQPKKGESNVPMTDNISICFIRLCLPTFVSMVGKDQASREWWQDSGAMCYDCNNIQLL